MNIKLLLATIMAFSGIHIVPVSPEMEIWSDGTHYRYLVKDFHADYIDGRESIKQQEDILWAAQQYDEKDIFVITEDTLSYSGNNQKIKNFYASVPTTIQEDIQTTQFRQGISFSKAPGSKEIFDTYNVSPIRCLSRACTTDGIRNFNAECNQSICIFKCEDLPITEALSQQEVIDELRQSVAQEKSGSLLHGDYVDFLECLAELQKIKDESDFIDEVTALRLAVVDLRTMQKLIEWGDIKHGFIFQGQTHIEGIKEGLTALGYKQIKSIGNSAVWDLPDDSEKEVRKISQCVLDNALDIRKTFEQIKKENIIK